MSSIVIAGDTSGSVTLQAPATAGSTTVNLPSTLGNAGASAFATTDSSGNLGVGVTPSIYWATNGYKAIDIGSPGCGFTSRQNNELTMCVNNAYNIYSVTGFAASKFGMTNVGSFIWQQAPAGTAGNTPSFTSAMTLDASGNLMVGTTTNSGARLKANYTTSAATGFTAVLSNMASPAVGNGAALIFNNSSSFSDSGFQYNSARIQSIQTASSGELAALTFSTYTGSNCSEKARIDSVGSFFVDCTATPNGSTRRGFSVVADTGLNDTTKIQIATTTTSSRALAEFNNGNGNVGSISVSGSATAYNTSSDYRLKNTIAPMTGALAKVALLRPVTYKWNADGSDGEGFIAHELAEVVPDCVTGEKDAIETYTDDDGNEQTRPTYQGIDVSFLVATLTAAIQEQQALITQLTERITALEAN